MPEISTGHHQPFVSRDCRKASDISHSHPPRLVQGFGKESTMPDKSYEEHKARLIASIRDMPRKPAKRAMKITPPKRNAPKKTS